MAMLSRRRRRRSQHEPDQSMPRRSSALKRGVVSWAWMLEKQESHGFIGKELSPAWSKEKEQCIGHRQAGHEEEEQCRRSRHSSRGTGVSSRRGP